MAKGLTVVQQRTLDLVLRNGRYGVGRGGVRRSTAEALVRKGVLKFDYDHFGGHLRQYLVPAAAVTSQLI
jgi:hypothetical protein